MRRVLAAAATVLVVLAAAGCGSNQSPAGGSSAAPQTLTVFAAASLKSTFTEIGDQFKASHPGVTVTFSFAGSSDLVTQIQGGAGADVFASADIKNMDKLTAEKLAGQTPANFASNTLEIITPPDNPAGVDSLDDLARKGLDLVICAPEVPCGSATEKVERSARLTFEPVSEEASVTDVLNKVVSKEADAGLVYVTDVKGAGDKVKGVTFPESSEAVNVYPIARLSASKNRELARQFVDAVTGEDGQQVLADAGFGKP
jgi:molybdate transport system substrate-binding protein